MGAEKGVVKTAPQSKEDLFPDRRQILFMRYPYLAMKVTLSIVPDLYYHAAVSLFVLFYPLGCYATSLYLVNTYS